MIKGIFLNSGVLGSLGIFSGMNDWERALGYILVN